MVLEKTKALFERDENGELIPKEIELVIDENEESQLEHKGETIFATPITRGELKKLFSRKPSEDDDIDSEIISKHCKTPEFTLEEAKDIMPPFSSMIVNTIFEVSGLENKNNKSRRKKFNDAEDEFAKN